jgi:hypothetical protein
VLVSGSERPRRDLDDRLARDVAARGASDRPFRLPAWNDLEGVDPRGVRRRRDDRDRSKAVARRPVAETLAQPGESRSLADSPLRFGSNLEREPSRGRQGTWFFDPSRRLLERREPPLARLKGPRARSLVSGYHFVVGDLFTRLAEPFASSRVVGASSGGAACIRGGEGVPRGWSQHSALP